MSLEERVEDLQSILKKLMNRIESMETHTLDLERRLKVVEAPKASAPTNGPSINIDRAQLQRLPFEHSYIAVDTVYSV